MTLGFSFVRVAANVSMHDLVTLSARAPFAPLGTNWFFTPRPGSAWLLYIRRYSRNMSRRYACDTTMRLSVRLTALARSLSDRLSRHHLVVASTLPETGIRQKPADKRYLPLPCFGCPPTTGLPYLLAPSLPFIFSS